MPSVIPSGRIQIRNNKGQYQSIIDNDEVPEISKCNDANPTFKFCGAYAGNFRAITLLYFKFLKNIA